MAELYARQAQCISDNSRRFRGHPEPLDYSHAHRQLLRRIGLLTRCLALMQRCIRKLPLRWVLSVDIGMLIVDVEIESAIGALDDVLISSVSRTTWTYSVTA